MQESRCSSGGGGRGMAPYGGTCYGRSRRKTGTVENRAMVRAGRY